MNSNKEKDIKEEKTKKIIYDVTNLNLPTIASESYKESLYEITKSFTAFSNPIVEKVISNNYNWSNLQISLARLVSNYNAKISIISDVTRRIIGFFGKINYSPLLKIANLLSGFDFDKFQNNLDNLYFEALCNAKWFPHAICTTNTELFSNINNVLYKTEATKKNRIKELDKVIFKFYNKKALNDLKRHWREKQLPNYIQRILCESVQAYQQKKYALTISALVPLWQGLIDLKVLEKQERKTDKKSKERLQNLLTENDCNDFVKTFCDEYIFYQCNGLEDVKDDVPGRHSVCHSWYNKYPSKKTALNAIIFTDFLLELEPIKKENTNEKF